VGKDLERGQRCEKVVHPCIKHYFKMIRNGVAVNYTHK